MDIMKELQRLWDSGARFSVEFGGPGCFRVRIGNYLRELAPGTEAQSIEDVVAWLCTHLQWRASAGNVVGDRFRVDMGFDADPASTPWNSRQP